MNELETSIATPAPDRITSLDVVRGIAVMGILLANMPAFALPEAAYFSPRAWGGSSTADIVAWLANYVFVEGRMRGLFSFLFGASMLLIGDRALAAERSPAQVHLTRLIVLFIIGVAHLYLIWWGDILAHYALVALVALAFVQASTRTLFLAGAAIAILSLAVSIGGYVALVDSAARDTPDAIAVWNDFAKGFGQPPQARLDAEVAAMLGPWVDQLRWRLAHATNPLSFVWIVGPQTLAAMLFGMAAYRSGLLTGQWPRRKLLLWAGAGLLFSIPFYVAVGLRTMASDFDQREVFFGAIVAGDVLRWPGIVGYTALIVALVRPGGWLTERIAAVGRAAFTNYLGTSILVTFVFYGWGLSQFAGWSRAAIYVILPIVWAIMLLWSKPWLDRFRYGPMEWAWRSLAGWKLQPMRKEAPKPVTES